VGGGGGAAPPRRYITSTIVPAEKKLNEFTVSYQAKQAELDKAQSDLKALKGNVEELVKERDRLELEVNRVKRTLAEKNKVYGEGSLLNKVAALIRGLPGLDLAAPPQRIQQISLPELTINYNFKEVPRYDRCATCHQAMDKLGYAASDPGNENLKPEFHSHPFLTHGASTVDPKGKVVPAGLYLDANGPHPINKFGCTICHGGQGSGTDFTFASHTPNSPKQEEEWKKEHGWEHVHHWDYPMYPKRFIEASCVKCHQQVTDIPQATKLQAGYQRVVKYGCTGCHAIGGEGVVGPDLSDERQVGPNLSHVASKVSRDWLVKWIKDPHAFRPDSRMPRFYGLNNNDGHEDWPKNHAEIQAITHYLFSKSTPPADFVDPPAKSDSKRGKELFLQKGCLACHQHKPYELSQIQEADRNFVNAAYKPDPALTFAPESFPAAVREYAKADFGPNLSNMAAKFQSKEQGHKFLTNWIQAPERYHSKSLMPNLQLSLQDAADVAAWIMSVPGEWPVNVEVPGVETKEVKESVDELVKLYVQKGGFKGKDGKTVVVPLSEIDAFVQKRGTEEKLSFLGEKTISRLGCFGCHSIPGFENAKSIGTSLSDWGLKNPARLDFGHITEYIEDQKTDDQGGRDGTAPYFLEELEGHTRTGFLYEKLHRPRSYDYLKKSEKYKTWDDRLRMPQFAWANDPDAVEEVMTFILGLTGEKVATKYLPKSRNTPSQMAVAEGAKLLNRFNCAGCHVLEMPKFTIPEGTKVAEAFTNFKTNLRSSYTSRATDYLKEFNPGLTYDPNAKLGADQIETSLAVKPDDGKTAITIEGMPIGLFENELSVQLWQPATIRGYTFNVGDIVALDQTKIQKVPAVGGDFAWLYSTDQAEKTGASLDTFWNRLPPPLLRQGNKVQTPWLMSFLKDPYPIRPAAQLRMPRFHFGKSDESPSRETEELANYFAARDHAEYPYQAIPEKTESYLAAKEKAHPNYLGAGWTMMANKASPCIQCHAIGAFKPTGGEQVVNGPDLRQVASRFRPDYLEAWIANPRRLLPYTAMPQNVVPHGTIQFPIPKEFEDKPVDVVRAIRDTLLNYVNAVEQQLAATKPDAPKAAMNVQGKPGAE